MYQDQIQEGRIVHKNLGSNNIVIVVADGYNANETPSLNLATCASHLAEKIKSYAVINCKYKKEIADLSDIRIILQRQRLIDTFLAPILRYKKEITQNALPPFILFLQTYPAQHKNDPMLLFGYGQGKRGVQTAPHRPTITASLLSKIRIALQDKHLQNALADTDSLYCGREDHSLNQLFRQKERLKEYYDPEVRSVLLSLRHDVLSDQKTSLSIAHILAAALQPFCQSMSLVRKVALSSIDISHTNDLQYIFRLTTDQNYKDLLRDSYIAELATSIKRNGLLHPLVLLKKHDGRYKILCGYRRYQALSNLKAEWVEAKVYQENDFSPEEFFNISLAENTKRRNLNPVEIGNFLETASHSLHLNNAELAVQFGATLAIGKPGQNVSQSTIHKYRKVYQMRARNESPEIISDIINEELPFSIAAEILAPLKSAQDRDSLYLHIIKPIRPTRPQIAQILALLPEEAPTLCDNIESEPVQKTIKKALKSTQPANTLINALGKRKNVTITPSKKALQREVDRLRKSYFGGQAGKKDFNIMPGAGRGTDELLIHFRVKKGEESSILAIIQTILKENDVFSYLEDPPKPSS